MKSIIKLGLWASLALFCLLGPVLRAQTSAVNAIAFGASGTVNTTWLGNAAASGIYTHVYIASGSNGTTTSQSGVKPTGMTISTSVTGTSTTYSLQSLNNVYYIRRRTQGAYCGGGTFWSENVFAGPYVNNSPVAAFSIKVGGLDVVRVRKGALVFVSGVVTDDANLTDVNLRELSPASGAIWVNGTSGAGTRWTGTGGGGGAGITVSKSAVFTTPGSWSYQLQVTDTWPANALVLAKAFTVADGLFYDVGNTYNGVAAVPSFGVSASPVALAGASSRVLMTLEVRDGQGVLMGAGKAVRVSVGHAAGLLFTASTGGTGAQALALTTAANGTVTFYWQGSTVAGAKAAIYAMAGNGAAEIAVSIRPSAAADTETTPDGMSNAMETALNGTTGVIYNPAAAAITGFRVFGP